MKPVQQVFALVLEKIWESKKNTPQLMKFKRNIENLRKEHGNDSEKYNEKVEDLRCKEIKALLFDAYLRETNNQKNGNQSIMKFASVK